VCQVVVTPASWGYPLSVLNKNSISKGRGEWKKGGAGCSRRSFMLRAFNNSKETKAYSAKSGNFRPNPANLGFSGRIHLPQSWGLARKRSWTPSFLPDFVWMIRTSRWALNSLGNKLIFFSDLYVTMYIHSYIYIRIYIYIHICICIHTYICMYMYTYVCIHIRIYIQVCACVYIYTYIRCIFDTNKIHSEAQTCSKQFICHCRTNCPKKYVIAEIEISRKSYLSFSCFVPRCSPHTIYMYTYIYICTYLYVYISVHIYTCIYTCVCVYIHTYIRRYHPHTRFPLIL